MTIIVITVLFLVFKALRERRPLKIVLTPEEARAVRDLWWSAAKGELVAWAVVSSIGLALLGQDLEATHWKTITYVTIVWVSLILFSRLAIWLTLAAAVMGYVASATGIHLWPAETPFVMVSACVYAIVVRAILFLFSRAGQVRHIAQRFPRRALRDLENRNS
jgi:hypothetical protein